MSELEFNQAPISEVVLGITFKDRVMSIQELFGFTEILKESYPILEIRNPLANQRLVDFKHITEIDNEKVSPFRVFQRTEDTNYLVQYQGNKIMFNWIRKDEKNVGYYPGFSLIKDKFDIILKSFFKYLDTTSFEVDFYDLTYQDRIKWNSYIPDLGQISEIMKLTPPNILIDGLNNLSSEYTYKAPSVNGYGILELTTATSLEDDQILKFQNTLRGHDALDNIDKWFSIAHENQVATFKKVFKPVVLEQWK